MPDEAPVTIATFPDCFSIVSSNRAGQIAGSTSFVKIKRRLIHDAYHDWYL
jgi:hypothetical protein